MSMQQCYKEIKGAIGYYTKKAVDAAVLKERNIHKRFLARVLKRIDKMQGKDQSRKNYNDYFVYEAGESIFDRTASIDEMSYYYLGKQDAYKEIKQLLGQVE